MPPGFSAASITDMDVCDTGNSNDGTNSSFLYFNLIQTVKLIELADFNFLTFVQIMMVMSQLLINVLPFSTLPTPIRPTYSL